MEPGDYDDPRGFHRKPAYQRLLILLAGPATNFLVAALIVTGLTLTQLNGDPGKIVGVFQCADTTKSPPCTPSPAWAAGLRPNDSIQSVNGQAVRQPEDIRRLEAAHPDQPLQMVVRKPDGRTVAVSVTPQFDSTQHMYLIGIENAPVISVKDAVTRGATFPFQLTGAIAIGLYQVASGQISGGFFGPSGLTGPVGIGYVTVESALGGWLAWLTVVAILSVALGLANLLPIPSLDGARMVVVLLEKLIGHPFNRELEMQVQRAGLYALLLLIAVISVFDVERIVSGQFPPIK
jgi:regulator of sigma E protease